VSELPVILIGYQYGSNEEENTWQAPSEEYCGEDSC